MSETAALARRPAWRRTLAEALDGYGRSWIFMIKGTLAVLLTGWLAMRFDLDRPGTAALTCAIVMHPQSGSVLAKSFYRCMGTLTGSLVAVGLFALMPQARWLLLTGLALWIGFCAGGASWYRNFKSYGFILAGATTTIVLLPVLGRGQPIFESAVMRVSEVLLGIIVAGVITDVVFPQRMSKALGATIRTQFTDFVAFVRDSMAGTRDRSALQEKHLGFVTQAVQLENLRASVVFEDAGVRAHSPRTRRVNQRFMAASTSYQSLHHLMNRLEKTEHNPARDALMEMFTWVSDALGDIDGDAAVVAQARELRQTLQSARKVLDVREDALRAEVTQPDQRLDFETGAELLRRFMDELESYADAYVDMVESRGRPIPEQVPETGFIHGNDLLGVATVGLRACLVLLLCGWFWIATAWQAGAYTMLVSALFCSIAAYAPVNPSRMINNMWKGWSLGGVAASFAMFGVIAHMDGFLLFAAGMVPFLLAGFYFYTRPALMGMGRGTVLSFIILMEPAFVMQFSMTQYLNQLLAFLLGIGVSGVAFKVLASADQSPFLYRRLINKLRQRVTRACISPLEGARERLESSSRDLYMEINIYTSGDSQAVRDLQSWVLSVLEMGRAVIDVRADINRVPGELGGQLKPIVEALKELYEAPSRARYAWVRRRIREAMRTARELGQDASLQHLHLLRLQLRDDDSTLMPGLHDGPTRATTAEATHAA